MKQELVQAQKISELKEAETINTKDMNIQFQNEIQKLNSVVKLIIVLLRNVLNEKISPKENKLCIC